ncbi:MAG TPA: hypothetical protein VHW23_42755 [Kofleriaceae bacterium]|nr:hypothetical protein [Kofleriaceae bacterium]
MVVNGDGEDDQAGHADMAIESFTEATTRYLAAQLIAAPRFPERWLLPRLRAPVFTNLGHQLLVDYEQLATIVWRVALDASAAVKHARKLWLTVGIGVLAAALGVVLCRFGALVLGGFELAIAGVALVVIKSRQDRIAHEAVADIRADALNRLSRSDWTCPEPAVTVTAQVGSGALGLDQRLWLPREALSEVHQLDPRAAARVFHASQILISCHATLTTFFVRVFPAGRSITFHVAVATLGPPMTGIATIANRMVKHHIEVLRRTKDRTVETPPPARTAAQLDEMAELNTVDFANHAQPSFQAALDLGEIVKLDPVEEIGRDPAGPCEYASARISSESAMWPGRITTRDALREAGSYDLTPSFFGRPEALSLIRTVYDQATRAALETADDAGYDISDYRDRDGRFTIHADQIGQVVVGDHVTMTNGDRPPAEHGKSDRQAPAASGSVQ